MSTPSFWLFPYFFSHRPFSAVPAGAVRKSSVFLWKITVDFIPLKLYVVKVNQRCLRAERSLVCAVYLLCFPSLPQAPDFITLCRSALRAVLTALFFLVFLRTETANPAETHGKQAAESFQTDTAAFYF